MKISNEAKTGIVIVMAIIATATFYIKTTSFNPAPYKIKTYFTYADGVKQDSIVKLSGIEVGRVTSIKFQYDPETKVEMELTLEQKAKLHEDTIAFIATSGMIGDAYIGLTPGSADKPIVKPGGTIASEDPVQMRLFWKKADAIASSLEATLGEVKALAANANILTTNINGVVTDNKPRINSILMNVEEMSVNFKDFSQDLKQHPWKLLMK